MRLSILVLAAVAVLAVAAPAGASTVEVTGGSLRYSGESAVVTTSLGGVFVVRDSSRLRAGNGCLPLSRNRAFCQAEGVKRIVAILRGDAPRFRSSAPHPVVRITPTPKES